MAPRDEDILLGMLSRGLPLTKAAFLAEFYSGEDLGPEFPLDAEIAAVVPGWLPGPLPEDFGAMLFPRRILRPSGALRALRRTGVPWTKQAYITALFHPEVVDDDELPWLLDLWVPSNLPGDVPGSVDDLVLATAPPEARVLAETKGWPSARAVAVARRTRDSGTDEAIIELLLQDALVQRVVREFGFSREDAAIHVIRLEPITPPLMSRHRLTKAEAIIELLRAGA